MRKLRMFLLAVTLTVLSSCAAADWFFGVDDNGNRTTTSPPSEFFIDFIQALGPVGLLASVGITTGGAAYVGNKKGQKPLTAVVAGIQKVKGDLEPGEKKALVGLLKKHIPNKYHKTIGKIKDAL